MDAPLSFDPAAILDYVTHLSLAAFITLTGIIAAADVLTAVLVAALARKLSIGLIATYLGSHVAIRLLPLSFLVILGHGIPVVELPPLVLFQAAAAASLTAYFLETCASIASTVIKYRSAEDQPPSPLKVATLADPLPTDGAAGAH